MRTTRLIPAVVLAASLVVPASAAGEIRYAEPEGDGPEATCPSTNPCDLEVAIEGPSVADGDEVVVLPGRYELPDLGLDPNRLNVFRSIHVHGESGSPPPTIASQRGIALFVSHAGARLSDLRVEVSEGVGVFLTAGVAERMSVTATGARLGAGPACRLIPDPSLPAPLLRDSICLTQDEGPAAALDVVRDSASPGVAEARVTNVTAVGPGSGVEVITRFDGAVRLDATNVIARRSGTFDAPDAADVLVTTSPEDPPSVGRSSEAVLANSNYRSFATLGAGTSLTPPTAAGNQTATPIFASPRTGDFRQLIGSPTIDAGTAGGMNSALLGPFDFEGEPRIQGPAPDIGGDEGSLASPFSFAGLARRLDELGVVVRCRLVRCAIRVRGVIRRGGGKGSRVSAAKPRPKRKYKLKPRLAELADGESRKVRLKLARKDRRKVEELLERGAAMRAKITADTGPLGYRERAQIRVKPPR